MDRLMAGPFFEKFYADASLLAYHPSNKQKRTKKESDCMSCTANNLVKQK